MRAIARISFQNSQPPEADTASTARGPHVRGEDQQQGENDIGNRATPRTRAPPSSARATCPTPRRAAALRDDDPGDRRAFAVDPHAGDVGDRLAPRAGRRRSRRPSPRRPLALRQRLELRRASPLALLRGWPRARHGRGGGRAAGPLAATPAQRRPPCVPRRARRGGPRAAARGSGRLGDGPHDHDALAPAADHLADVTRVDARRSRTTGPRARAAAWRTSSSPAAGRPGFVGVACTGPTARWSTPASASSTCAGECVERPRSARPRRPARAPLRGACRPGPRARRRRRTRSGEVGPVVERGTARRARRRARGSAAADASSVVVARRPCRAAAPCRRRPRARPAGSPRAGGRTPGRAGLSPGGPAALRNRSASGRSLAVRWGCPSPIRGIDPTAVSAREAVFHGSHARAGHDRGHRSWSCSRPGALAPGACAEPGRAHASATSWRCAAAARRSSRPTLAPSAVRRAAPHWPCAGESSIAAPIALARLRPASSGGYHRHYGSPLRAERAALRPPTVRT